MSAQSGSVQPAAGVGEDLYHALGVAPDAEREVIDAAYRALARKYHPDVNRAPEAQRRMQTINDAYAILRDPAQRRAYDRARSGQPGGSHSPSPGAAPPAAPPQPDGAARPTTASPDGGVSGGVFRTAAADVWRGWRTRQARESARRFTLGAAAVVVVALLGFGAVAAWRTWQGAPSRSVPTYWRAAEAARAQIDASRRTYETAKGSGTYAAAVSNADFASAAGRLVADLDTAIVRLKSVNRIPPEVETYHFLQLQDWQEERQLVLAYRDAAVTRNVDLWARAAEVEAAWRASSAHQQTEVLARQLATG